MRGPSHKIPPGTPPPDAGKAASGVGRAVNIKAVGTCIRKRNGILRRSLPAGKTHNRPSPNGLIRTIRFFSDIFIHAAQKLISRAGRVPPGALERRAFWMAGLGAFGILLKRFEESPKPAESYQNRETAVGLFAQVNDLLPHRWRTARGGAT